MNRSILRWIAALCCLLPAVLPLYMLVRFGNDFPFWDQWEPDIAGVHIKWHQGTLRFADLVAQHYEHRILVPRLIWLPLAWMTHWNTIAETVCAWFIAILISLSVRFLIRKTLESAPQRAVVWLLCNLLIFSPAQWETWVWGIGVANLLPMLFIVLTVVSAASSLRRPIRIALIILCCSAATYSAGQGIVSWPIALILLAFADSTSQLKLRLINCGIVLLAMLIIVGLYFVVYVSPAHAEEQASSPAVVSMLQFWFAFLGNFFAATTSSSPGTVATIFGVMLVLLYAGAAAYAFFVRFKVRDHEAGSRLLLWVALAFSSLLIAALGAFTRTGFGIDRALLARYVTFSLNLPLALIPLAFLVCEDARRRFAADPKSIVGLLAVQVPAVHCALLVLFYVLGFGSAFKSARSWSFSRERGKGAVMLMNILPDNFELQNHITGSPNYILEQAPILSEMGYFNPPLIRSANAALIQSASGASTAAQGIFEQVIKPDEKTLTCSGYAIFPQRSRPACAVFITCSNARGEPTIVAMAVQGPGRSDLISRFGAEEYGYAGWTATVSISRLPLELARMELAAWALDTHTGRAYRLTGEFAVRQ